MYYFTAASPYKDFLDVYGGVIRSDLIKYRLDPILIFISVVCGILAAVCSCIFIATYINIWLILTCLFIVPMTAGIIAWCVLIGPNLEHYNSIKMLQTLLHPTTVYISSKSAWDTKLEVSLWATQARVSLEIYRPNCCTDYISYMDVIEDAHDTYIVYNKKYKQIVILDPNLFL